MNSLKQNNVTSLFLYQFSLENPELQQSAKETQDGNTMGKNKELKNMEVTEDLRS